MTDGYGRNGNMTEPREQTLADVIIEVLTDGPATGYEIAREMEQRDGVVLRGREGALYAALMQLEKEGFVTAAWSESSDGRRRRRYELPVFEETGRTS